MDLFKFVPEAPDDGYLTQGQYINGIKNITWIERYREPGEFTITGPVSSNLRMFLPLGTLISHIDTLEVMMVENHEIDEKSSDSEPEIVVTGRSLDAWLEQRIVGEDVETYVFAGHRLYTFLVDYRLEYNTSWEQTRTLIDAHIGVGAGDTPENEIPGFIAVSNQQHIGSSTTQLRFMKRQNLHRAVMELLAVDDFGLMISRPNPTNVIPAKTEFRIHNGFDMSGQVVFSHVAGDLQNARYFWSNKTLKTDYYAVSTFIQLRSQSPATGFGRRTLYVDASDLDSHLTDEDIGDGEIMGPLGDATDVRGQQTLRMHTERAILSTDIAKTTAYQFRRDYDVGDLVAVNGNYDISTVMRVTEHVEFQDENGESGYPTLSALNE